MTLLLHLKPCGLTDLVVKLFLVGLYLEKKGENMKTKKCFDKSCLQIVAVLLSVLFFVSCGGGGGGSSGGGVAVTAVTSQSAENTVSAYEEVAASDLDGYLKSKDENDAATAYAIKITGLDASNSTQLKEILKANPTKYVDLSSTQLPDGINLRYGFSSCTTLTKSPVLPTGTTDLANCFFGCSSLVEAPTIPNTVTSMNTCFMNCTSLTTVPNISTSVTDMSFCFSGCTSLTQVPDIPESVYIMTNCFQNCSALEAVRIRTTIVAYGKWENCFKGSKADILITVPVTNPTDGVKTNITNWPCHSHLTNVVVASSE